MNRPDWQLDGSARIQYGSVPTVGGLVNFLRAHIGLVTLLERIGAIPGIEVTITDEGRYGLSHSSTDWEEALEEDREPTYQRFPGRYDVAAFVEEGGRWNQSVTAVLGAVSDAAAQTDGSEVGAAAKSGVGACGRMHIDVGDAPAYTTACGGATPGTRPPRLSRRVGDGTG